MQIYFKESQKNDTTEKIESSKQVHYIKQTQHNSSTNLCKFSESQKNDTTEKIESSKRTNGFLDSIFSVVSFF